MVTCTTAESSPLISFSDTNKLLVGALWLEVELQQQWELL